MFYVCIHFIVISASLVYNALSQREAMKNLSFKDSPSHLFLQNIITKSWIPLKEVLLNNTEVWLPKQREEVYPDLTFTFLFILHAVLYLESWPVLCKNGSNAKSRCGCEASAIDSWCFLFLWPTNEREHALLQFSSLSPFALSPLRVESNLEVKGRTFLVRSDSSFSHKHLQQSWRSNKTN